MATYVLGLDAVLYYDDTALNGSNTATVLNTATEADNVKDVTLSLTKESADITTRGAAGWTCSVGTLKDAEVSFQMQWEPGDGFFEAVKDSYLNSTELVLFVLSGAKTDPDAEGFTANFNIFSFTRNEALTEALTVDVTAKPSSYPEWYEVGS